VNIGAFAFRVRISQSRLVFESPDLVADGRLRQAENFGRARHAAVLFDRDQCAQGIDIQAAAHQSGHDNPRSKQR